MIMQRRASPWRKACALGRLIAAMAAALLLPRTSAAADARADLSFVANPNGVWTYASFDLSTTTALPSHTPNSSTLESWHPAAGDYPYVGLTTITPDGFVSLHPGDVTSGLNPWGALIFTAPTPAVYRFTGEFRALDGAGAGTISDFLIRTPESTALYSGGLRFFGGPTNHMFNFARTLLTGQSIMFAVGDGRVAYPETFNGSAFDNTGLKLAVNPLTPGDFNRDLKVDGADLVRWRIDYGPSPISDADIDGDSDGTDFLLWQLNVGAGVMMATAVPEPSAAILLLLGGVTWCRRRFRG
jgi:hypothetical protein